MARAFTQTGKELIRQNLLRKGREYFIKYGLKKTSVDELAQAAGIAKGSFYKFYDSKEALFLAIHEETEEKLQMEMAQKLESAKEPLDKLRAFFKGSFLILEEDPLLQVVFSGGEFENLTGFLASAQYQEHYRQDILFLEELIKKWQDEGIVRQLDAKAASNMIATVYFVVLQKEALGEEMYKKVTDMLAESLANYLCGPK